MSEADGTRIWFGNVHRVVTGLLLGLLGLIAAGFCGCASSIFEAKPPQATSICDSVPSESRGKLLIIGGGLSDDNEAVYRAFIDGAIQSAKRARQRRTSDGNDVSIVVLPTASGVPDESGEKSAEAIRRYLPEDANINVRVLPVSVERPGLADLVGASMVVADADGIWFTGGDQSRITGILRPGGRTTAVDCWIREALAAGAIIAGTSAGAAIMGDPMITGGRSEEWLDLYLRSVPPHTQRPPPPASVADGWPGEAVKPPEDGFEVLPLAAGMGYLPRVVTDQHLLKRGRFGRLLAAAGCAESGLGIGVADDRAVLVDLAEGSARAIGDRAAVIVDHRRLDAEVSTWRTSGIRVSLLNDGDVSFLGATDRRVLPSVACGPTVTVKPEWKAESPRLLDGDAWDPGLIGQALTELAGGEDQAVRIESEGIVLVFAKDGQTHAYQRRDRPEVWTIDRAVCEFGRQEVQEPKP